MKLLWLSHFIPYPPRGGAHQRSFNLIRHMSRKADVTLVAINHEGHAQDRLAEYVGEMKKYCAGVETWELPYRWRGLRWWAEFLVNTVGHYPFGCRARWSPELGLRWRKVLEKHPESIIHFDSIDLALYIPATEKRRKVLNHHNCESAMARRRAQLEPNRVKQTFLGREATKLERLERTLCAQFDMNITVSVLDADFLRSHNPSAHFHVVENGTDTRFFVPTEAPPESGSLIFAGSLGWYPNLSAIRYFDEKIWPLVKQQRPDARLYIAGQTPPSWLIAWAQHDPSITLVPDPEDIRPWVARAAVFICPIIDGGGTRLKILDALAMGKAVVSTTVGCEGLSVTNGENILVADSPEDFTHQVVRLLDDETLRARIAANGRAMVERVYSWDVIGDHLEQAYRSALAAKERPA